ncbi:hypothetical protein RB594_007241 [Gaeumannomyces avenae]
MADEHEKGRPTASTRTGAAEQGADGHTASPSSWPSPTPGGEPTSSSGGNSRLGPRPAVFRSTLHEVVFVFQATLATMSSSFLVGASSTVLAPIARDLGMTQGEVSWISASTSLTAGASQLALGQLADLLGRRPMFIAGMGSFAAFAAVTGLARSPLWMDALCGLLGVSSAMMVPSAIGILGAAYASPSKRKNLAFSAFSSGNPVGFAIGSVLGGVAAQVLNWRASFYLIAILWGIFTVVAFWAVPSVEAEQPLVSGGDSSAGEMEESLSRPPPPPPPPRPSPSAPLREKLGDFFRRFDSVGAFLTLFGTGMFTAAITLGPEDGWGAPQVIALLVVGLVLIAVFLYWETIWPHPLMPPKIWKDRNFTLLIVTLVFGFMSFQSASFWLALFLQQIQRRDPLDVALHLLPQTIAGLTWNIVAGSILHKVNNTLLHGIGAVSYLVANLLLSLMGPDSNYWAYVFPALIINVIGADFQFNVANMYVMQSLPSHQQGLAGGILNTMIRLCSTVALGISTAVFGSVGRSPEGVANPMLQYTRAFQVSVALAAFGLLFVPFIKVGTQGNHKHVSDETSELSLSGTGDAPIVGAGAGTAAGAAGQPAPTTKGQ